MGWLGGALRGPSTPEVIPEPQDNVDALVEEFLAAGRLVVPSPDGYGNYILLKQLSMKGFTVTLTWQGGPTHIYLYPGGEIPWSPYGPDWCDPGFNYRSWDAGSLAATLIQIIQSGTKIYLNNCGEMINSVTQTQQVR